jgi:S-formylglutathione hydrolase
LGNAVYSEPWAICFATRRAGDQVASPLVELDGGIMTLQVVSQSRCFGGTQFTYQHKSSETGTMMRFAAFVPPDTRRSPFPIVWYLSGLTCTEENFTVKAGAQRVAAELGLLLIAPDTSPRGDAVPRDPAGSYDLGLGAGFYVDATQEPWSRNYKMASSLSVSFLRW